MPRNTNHILRWVDQWMLTLASGLVVVVWVTADATGLVLSEGTKAALAAFVGYTLLKMRVDGRWRALEGDSQQLDVARQVASKIQAAPPGSPEALKASSELAAVVLSESEKKSKGKKGKP